jgi:hypothetical protein
VREWAASDVVSFRRGTGFSDRSNGVMGESENSRSLHCAAFHPVDEDLSPGTPGFAAPVEMTIR